MNASRFSRGQSDASASDNGARTSLSASLPRQAQTNKSQIHKDQFRQQSGALDGFNMTLVFTFLPKRYLRVRNFDSKDKREAELGAEGGGEGCPRSDFGDYAAAPSLTYHVHSPNYFRRYK